MSLPVHSLLFLFRAQPLGHGVALLALIFLACSGEAMAMGVRDACTPVATAALPATREGHGEICGTPSAPHGVIPIRHVISPRRLGVGGAGNLLPHKQDQATTTRAAVTAAPSDLYSAGMVVTPAASGEARALVGHSPEGDGP